MIKLKNGIEIAYNQDFDEFFKELLETIIFESKSEVDNNNTTDQSIDILNESFLKELMDNCIFITHQLFSMDEEHQELAQFMVSGFIFNSLLLLIQTNKLIDDSDMIEDDEDTLH